jgi:hypothetical protein
VTESQPATRAGLEPAGTGELGAERPRAHHAVRLHHQGRDLGRSAGRVVEDARRQRQGTRAHRMAAREGHQVRTRTLFLQNINVGD